MKKILFSLSCACLLFCAQTQAERYVGGDISMLPMYEEHNSAYLDLDGKAIDDLLVWFIEECGWNTFRVRIFVNPTAGDGVVQTTEYVAALGKRIKDAGAYFMLDFHYSDTWVDATHIQPPAAWKGASAEAMADSLGQYTKRTLDALIQAGAKPDMVQVGNEIMYGVCGIKVAPYDNASVNGNWPAYINLLKAGCNAVREKCPEAQIIIHSDRPTNRSYNFYYYNKLVEGGVDFDVIGLSYYPFWHGYLTPELANANGQKDNLVTAINNLAVQFPNKRVQIVETAYNFQWWPTAGINYNTQSTWACSIQGQYNFVKDLVDALSPLPNLDGISYWFPEEAGNGDDTNWSTSKGTVISTWQNRGFWDENTSQTGHKIHKTGVVLPPFNSAKDVCAPYYLGTFVDNNTEGLPEQTIGDTIEVKKVLENGQLFILVGNKKYTASGSIVQ